MNAVAERALLLVEDNPGDADLVVEMLEQDAARNGFSVAVVGRLSEALARLDQSAFDAVLLDLGLPDASGLNGLRALRAQGEFPIVVLTGTDDEALALACVDAGADDYLSKGELRGPSLRRAIAHSIARRREQLLHERSRTLFETLNLIVLELDREGRIQYVNGFFHRSTGWRPDETLHRDVFGFIPEDERAAALDKFAGLLEGNRNQHVEVPILARDGGRLSVAWHNTVLRDAQGRAVGTLSIGEDVTDHRRLEARLRQSQKLEGIGRLAGGIAHDFNNLLAVVLGNAELLAPHLDGRDEPRELLDEIQGAAQRAAALTRQLLAFGRRQVLRPRELAVNDQVLELRRMLDRIIGEHIEVVTELAPDAGVVSVDPAQFDQVLMNLVLNARDAMAGGGRLTITTRAIEVDAALAAELGELGPGRYVQLAVSDTGHGMDREVLAQVFEPFFTTKHAGDGSGLGLATVYGIVRQSGGLVTAYSEPGWGSAFNVYLPQVGAAAPADAGAPPPPEPVGPATATVLVVEDDASVRRLAQRLLLQHGHRVLVATDGADGLELFERAGAEVDVILSDVVMPRLGGREMMARIRQRGSQVPVVFMSGYASDAIDRGGKLMPGAPFLQKPFSRDMLLRTVAAALAAAR